MLFSFLITSFNYFLVDIDFFIKRDRTIVLIKVSLKPLPLKLLIKIKNPPHIVTMGQDI